MATAHSLAAAAATMRRRPDDARQRSTQRSTSASISTRTWCKSHLFRSLCLSVPGRTTIGTSSVSAACHPVAQAGLATTASVTAAPTLQSCPRPRSFWASIEAYPEGPGVTTSGPFSCSLPERLEQRSVPAIRRVDVTKPAQRRQRRTTRRSRSSAEEGNSDIKPGGSDASQPHHSVDAHKAGEELAGASPSPTSASSPASLLDHVASRLHNSPQNHLDSIERILALIMSAIKSKDWTWKQTAHVVTILLVPAIAFAVAIVAAGWLVHTLASLPPVVTVLGLGTSVGAGAVVRYNRRTRQRELGDRERLSSTDADPPSS